MCACLASTLRPKRALETEFNDLTLRLLKSSSNSNCCSSSLVLSPQYALKVQGCGGSPWYSPRLPKLALEYADERRFKRLLHGRVAKIVVGKSRISVLTALKLLWRNTLRIIS